MAFTRDTFQKAAGAGSNAPNIHTYRSNDTAATIDASGYFNNIADLLKVGDLIYAHCDADSSDTYGFCVVLSNTGTVVDVSNFTAIGAIDSD